MKKRITIYLMSCMVFLICRTSMSQTCIDSQDYPIKVCNEIEVDQTYLVTVLQFAEYTWDLMKNELDFPSPWRLNDNGETEEGIKVVIKDLGYYEGYSEATADIPETPNSDCASLIYIAPSLPDYSLALTIGQNLSIAFQYANDCAELNFSAVAYYMEYITLESLNYPVDTYLTDYFSRYTTAYQEHPYFALDYYNFNDRTLRRYFFGQAFFHMFLDERWGDAEGKIISEISEASKQDGTIGIQEGSPYLTDVQNNPDWYDAIDSMLKTKEADLWQAVKEFSIWRLYTGDLADDNHLRYADLFDTVTIDSSFDIADLPLQNYTPENFPQETGTSYILLTINSSMINSDEDFIQFDLNASNSDNWYLAAVVFNSDETSEVIDQEISNKTGEVIIKGLQSTNKIIFAATNLGDLEHNSEAQDWDEGEFTYNITFNYEIQINSVEPQQVEQGQQGVNITIEGIGFNSDIGIEFGEGIEVVSKIVDITGKKMIVKINVDENAPAGWHSLRLFYDNGNETTLEQGIEVVSGQGPVITEITPNSAEPDGNPINITIKGERFKEQVQIAFSGEGITVAQIDFIDNNTLIAGITIDPEAEPGKRNVTVTNPDLQSSTFTEGFTIIGEDNDNGSGCNISMKQNSKENLLFLFLFSIIISLFIKRK